ncbi:MAG: gfo/Idh/MocA family oxidoreductase, partial [Planctomycetes bacterium]|nr:gfo/Idh/MocA family oxidoreductase [Planctomycetota bacterium]
MKPRQPIYRRTLLKGSALGLVAVSGPTIIPSTVLGKDGATAPSDRIVLGAIGIGPRGRYVLGRMLEEKGVQFVAIADVQKSRREYVKQMADRKYGNKDCVMYRDMFELLGRKDVDSVLIATGDHWHALASILAAKAG